MHWQEINDFIRSKSLNVANKENQKLNEQFEYLNNECRRLPVQIQKDKPNTIFEDIYFQQRNNSHKLPKLKTQRPCHKPKALSNDEIKVNRIPLEARRSSLMSDKFSLNPRARGRIKLEPIKVLFFS